MLSFSRGKRGETPTQYHTTRRNTDTIFRIYMTHICAHENSYVIAPFINSAENDLARVDFHTTTVEWTMTTMIILSLESVSRALRFARFVVVVCLLFCCYYYYYQPLWDCVCMCLTNIRVCGSRKLWHHPHTHSNALSSHLLKLKNTLKAIHKAF